MLKIIRISEYSGLKDYKGAWEDLLSRSGADNIFLTYEWIDALIRHFHKKERLLILNIYDEERLVGIAPLTVRRFKHYGLPVKAVCFIGSSVSDRMDFIIADDRDRIVGVILDYLKSMRSEWDIIDLQEIAESSGTVQAIEAWSERNKVRNILRSSKKSFFIQLSGDKDLYRERFSTNLRRKINRMANKKAGLDLKFESYTDPAAVDDLFLAMRNLEDKSWKGEAMDGIFSKDQTRDFHREIFDTFLKNKWISVSVLSLEGKPIAYMYNYLYSRRLYLYNHSFDRGYLDISPGTLLMLWTLKDSVSKDIDEFDFGRGQETWKTRFTQDFRIHHQIKIFNDRFYPSFLYYLRTRIKPCVRAGRMFYPRLMETEKKSIKMKPKMNFKDRVKDLFYYCGVSSSAIRLLRCTGGPKLLVLMYHRVSSSSDALDYLGVPLDVFDRHMEFVKNNFKTVSMIDGLKALREGRSNEIYAAVNLDDGYMDNYLYAYPVLSKYRIPATIFLTTDFIGKEHMFWWDRVFDIVSSAGTGEVKIELGSQIYNFNLSGPHSKSHIANNISKILVNKKQEEIEETVRRLEETTHGIKKPGPALMLGWKEIKKMQEGLINFGAHTKTHRNLCLLNDDELREELEGSKQEIERNLGTEAVEFCYPFGRFDERVKAFVEEAGFKCARTTLSGFNYREVDRFLLRAVGVESLRKVSFLAARIIAALFKSSGGERG